MRYSSKLPNSPALVGAVALLAWLVFVVVRLVRLGDGDIGYFVLAGTDFTDSLAGLPLLEGAGYDGQFFHRLAVDPFDADKRVAGTVLDSTWRATRIGFPLLAWVISMSGISTAWSLVVVNLLAVGSLGYLGGHIARSANRHAGWGLLLPVYFGFAFSIARDLGEVVATAALVGGVLLATRRRFLLAGLCLSLAVLSRETVVAAVVLIGLTDCVTIVRRRRKWGAPDLVWLMPIIVAGLWQVIIVLRWDRGVFEIGAGTGSLRGPGTALLDQLPEVFSRAYISADVLNAVHAIEVLVLLAVTVGAMVSLFRGEHLSVVRSAFFGLALMMLTTDVPVGIWTDRNDLRMFAGVYAIAVIILLQTKVRLHLLAVSVTVCTSAAALSFIAGA
ncbi:MAG: hypothetical protein EBS76_05225 [Actinobacteria bacterium]|nr:hypothetical protein [Actinomycetota bacterium]